MLSSSTKWLLSRYGSVMNNATTVQRSLFEGNESNTFKVEHLSEKVMFEGYRNIVQRDVQLPNGKNVSYDILDNKFPSVVVFVWDSKTSTSVLLKEYHPGPKRFLMGVVAGAYESKKHSSALEAAQFELEEEAQLQTDTWIPLLASGSSMIPLDKYSTNEFYPYLAMDCTPVTSPRLMDEEEYITVEHNVTYTRLMSLIQDGEVNLISSFTILLALKKLKEMKIHVE
jgi:hypothetical protein